MSHYKTHILFQKINDYINMLELVTSSFAHIIDKIGNLNFVLFQDFCLKSIVSKMTSPEISSTPIP